MFMNFKFRKMDFLNSETGFIVVGHNTPDSSINLCHLQSCDPSHLHSVLRHSVFALWSLCFTAAC